MGLKSSFHLNFVECLWIAKSSGSCMCFGSWHNWTHCEAETLGTATMQIISIYIISTFITVVNNSSNLIHHFLCCLGNRASIPMDFMPGIGNHSSHVHKTALQAVMNCANQTFQTRAPTQCQMDASAGLGLGTGLARHGTPSAVGHSVTTSSHRFLLSTPVLRAQSPRSPWARE